MKLSVGDLNDWKILTLHPTEGSLPEEIQEIYNSTLQVEETNAADEMQNGNYAAYQHEDGYYVFKIVGHPYSLETDLESGVEGCGHLPEGTIVCKGVYMNEVGRAPRWHTPPPGRSPPKHIFRVRYVVDPNLEMEDPSETVKLPNLIERVMTRFSKRDPKEYPLRLTIRLLQS